VYLYEVETGAHRRIIHGAHGAPAPGKNEKVVLMFCE